MALLQGHTESQGHTRESKTPDSQQISGLGIRIARVFQVKFKLIMPISGLVPLHKGVHLEDGSSYLTNQVCQAAHQTQITLVMHPLASVQTMGMDRGPSGFPISVHGHHLDSPSPNSQPLIAT